MTGDQTDEPDNPGIVPRYLLRKIEAEKRYPNSPSRRAAFVAGAEYEAEHCDDPPG